MANTLEQLEYQLKLLYQDYIIKEGAIDTGALLNSIEVQVTFDEDGPKVDVASEPYLIFVDDGTRYIEPREITKQWENDPVFEAIMEEITLLWTEYYLERNLFGKRDQKGKFTIK